MGFTRHYSWDWEYLVLSEVSLDVQFAEYIISDWQKEVKELGSPVFKKKNIKTNTGTKSWREFASAEDVTVLYTSEYDVLFLHHKEGKVSLFLKSRNRKE